MYNTMTTASVPPIVCTPKLDNCINGLTLKEPVSVQLLHKLCYSTLLKKTFNNKICKKWYDSELQQIQKYIELVTNGYAMITYEKNKNNPYGRCNPKRGLGFHNLRRELRHTLASSTFSDIDIENCHCVMLQQILHGADVPCPILDDYVANRDAWLALVIAYYKIADRKDSRDIAKRLLIRLMYGGTLQAWASEFNIDVSIHHGRLIEFQIEMQRINDTVASHNPEIVEIARSLKRDEGSNLYGTVCSYMLQEYESQVLECVYLYCVKNGFVQDGVCALCADGLMIPTTLFKPCLLDDLSVEVERVTGFKLRFTNKAMTSGYTDKEIADSLEFPILCNTRSIAEVFRALHMDKFIVFYNNLYKYNGVYWALDDSKKHSVLQNFVATTFYNELRNNASKLHYNMSRKALDPELSDSEKEKIDKFLVDNTDYQQSIYNVLLNAGKRSEFISDIISVLSIDNIEFDANPFLFACENAVFDIRTGRIVKPEPTMYISKTTGWHWSFGGRTDTSLLESIIDTVLPDAEMRDFYLTALATGLCGIQQPHIFICSGVGGNGKSMMHELMLATLGAYAYKLPSSALLTEIKEGPNPTIANLNNARFALTSEPSANKRINTSTMKELTGSPTLSVRGLYSSITFICLLCSLFLEANTLPLFDEVNQAVIRRLMSIPFKSRFMPKHQYDVETKGMTADEIRDARIYVANERFIDAEFRNAQRQAFLTILMRYFAVFYAGGMKFKVPKESQAASLAYAEDSDDLFGWINDACEPAADKFIYIKDLYDMYSDSAYFANLSKTEKRRQNLKWFDNAVSTNTFFGKHYRKRDSRFAGTQHSKPYIAGFQFVSKKPAVPLFVGDDDEGSTTADSISE